MSQSVSGRYNLHHVLYVSRATRNSYRSQAECVRHILKFATVNNARLDVTGALLACDDWFVQILEGRRVDVDGILERIGRDINHGDIRKIASGPIGKRNFASWSMCASILSPTDKAIVEALKTNGHFDARKLNAVSAMRLLLSVGRLQLADAPLAA